MRRWSIPFLVAAASLVALLAIRGAGKSQGTPHAAPDSSFSFGATDSVPGSRVSHQCPAGTKLKCTDVVTKVRLARNRRVDVSYPRTMKSDESAAIELKYAVTIDTTGTPDADSLGTRKKSVSLSGANFAVKPDETRPLVWHGRDTATIVWSVLPARTGAHNLVVDASTLYDGQSVQVVVFDMKGDKVRDLHADNVVLPVDVVSVWGLSDRVVDVIKAGLGLLTFGLSFVGFAELRAWQRGRRATASSV